MAKRVRAEQPKEEDEAEVNSYFTSDKENLLFTSTGCTLLNCVIGGGYAQGRMVNIIGDKSTAKTGLSTEALINFKLTFPDGHAAYRETEGAYDEAYSEAMGLPVDQIDFGPEDPIDTVEKFDKDFRAFIEKCMKDDVPGIYVLDSFDSLSDEAEMKADLSDGSYGMAKQKKVGIMFRKLNKKIEKSKVLLIIVSQVRENINAMFGEKYRRSGGKALDFYASQIFWLAHTGMLKRTVKKVERTYGVSIKANCKKNKVGFPFRTCEFDFIFGYGIDDVAASVNWLYEVDRLKELGYKAGKKAELKAVADQIKALEGKEYRRAKKELDRHVIAVWREIEENFLPKKGKYR
jgi:recombination protein RecA